MTKFVQSIPLKDLACETISYGIVQPGIIDPTGVPILRVKNIRNRKIDFSDTLRVSADVESKFSRTRLRGGEVLLTLVGSVGEVAIATDKVIGWNVARAIAVVRPSEQVSAKWLALFLSSEYAQQYFRDRLNTTVQATLNLSDVRTLPVPMPPLAERQAICEVAEALDNKIAVNERVIHTADELAAALFERMFAEALQYLEERSNLPTTWQVSTLGDSTSVIEAGTRPKGGVSQYTSGVPSVGAESIVGLGRFDFSKTKFVPEEFFSSMRRGIVQDRDILVYKDGGRPGDFRPHVSMFGDGFPFDSMCINEHVFRVRMKESIGQEFGYYWLSSLPIMVEMRRRGTGAAIPGMNSTAFKGIPVIVPPPERCSAFAGITRPLIGTVFHTAAEIQHLVGLRDALLPQLMSGRLHIKEAEKIVEDAT